MFTENIIGVRVEGYVKLKNLDYKWDNGKVLPFVLHDDNFYYCVNLGYIQPYKAENCEYL